MSESDPRSEPIIVQGATKGGEPSQVSDQSSQQEMPKTSIEVEDSRVSPDQSSEQQVSEAATSDQPSSSQEQSGQRRGRRRAEGPDDSLRRPSFYPPEQPARPEEPERAQCDPDAPTSRDLLDIGRDVEAFASVLAARDLAPPLCVGLFGDWGAGKSSFMLQLQERIAALAREAQRIARPSPGEEANDPTAYCRQVVQVRFNAWHYVDTNLLVSLANHIFASLSEFISEGERAAALAENLDELKQLQAERAEAQRSLSAAEQELRQAQQALEAHRQAWERRPADRKRIAELLWQQAQQKPEVKATIDKARELIGRTGAVQSAQQVEELLGELQTTRGRTRTVLAGLLSGPDVWVRVLLLIAMAVCIPVLARLADRLLTLWGGSYADSALARLVAQVGGFISLAVLNLRAWLDRGNAVVAAADSVNQLYEQARPQQDKQGENLAQQCEAALNKLDAAGQALQDLDLRIANTQGRIADLQHEDASRNRNLSEFVKSVTASEAYAKEMGVVSVIHRDLVELDRRLRLQWTPTPHKTGDPSAGLLPKVDRIVLYIDDLDRCPEDKVVLVLQAVHLLLGLPLFVVVVAVDPRSLVRSLEKHYAPSLEIKPGGPWLSEEEAWRWAITPQEYLEKIFQIPVTLRPLTETGLGSLVSGVTQPSAGRVGGAPEPPHPNPRPLQLEEYERDYIRQLWRMIRTPRTAKRFVNVYRVIRAAANAQMRDALVVQEDYRFVMILLGILTGYPRLAHDVFAWIKLNGKPATDFWDRLLGQMAPHRAAKKAESYSVAMAEREVGHPEADEWRHLRQDLLALQKAVGLPAPPALYATWVERVEMFSFRITRV